MPATMLLDQVRWDIVLDINGNIAVATEPYSLAQDAASAVKTFLGEVFYDTTVGIPYLTQILGKRPSLSLLKAQFTAAALTVPDVASAEVVITALTDRGLKGQVKVRSAATGQTSVAPFSVLSPQGGPT